MVSRNFGIQFLSSCVTVVSILPSCTGCEQCAVLVANFDLEFERDVLLAEILGLVHLAEAFDLATEVDGLAWEIGLRRRLRADRLRWCENTAWTMASGLSAAMAIHADARSNAEASDFTKAYSTTVLQPRRERSQ